MAYKIIWEYYYEMFEDAQTASKGMNYLGQKGWEAFSVQTGSGNYRTVYFKRRVKVWEP